MIEPILLAAACIYTFDQKRPLTNARGFFFARDERLFLVTSRHVVIDEPSRHFPNLIEIELHTDPDNLTQSTGFSIPLYRDGRSIWRQGQDSAGEIDVAVIEIERAALPATTVYRAFTTSHLAGEHAPVEIRTSLLVMGFRLGLHDTLHQMPVVRQAVLASLFSLRLKGQGYFFTDARRDARPIARVRTRRSDRDVVRRRPRGSPLEIHHEHRPDVPASAAVPAAVVGDRLDQRVRRRGAGKGRGRLRPRVITRQRGRKARRRDSGERAADPCPGLGPDRAHGAPVGDRARSEGLAQLRGRARRVAAGPA